MVIRACRDCGKRGSEAPNDPAPALCPNCYEARLQRITPQFNVMCERLRDPRLVAEWLEHELVETGGELPQYARWHAQDLLRRALWATAWRN